MRAGRGRAPRKGPGVGRRFPPSRRAEAAAPPYAAAGSASGAVASPARCAVAFEVPS